MLARLLSTEYASIKNAEISVLVRGTDKAAVMEAKGIRVMLFNSFDDHSVIKRAASDHDRTVINSPRDPAHVDNEHSCAAYRLRLPHRNRQVVTRRSCGAEAEDRTGSFLHAHVGHVERIG